MAHKANIMRGVSFDAGQVLSTSERNRLWNTANSSRSMDICRTRNIGFQSNSIIEETLTAKYIRRTGNKKNNPQLTSAPAGQKLIFKKRTA